MSRVDTIISRLPGFYQSQDRQNVLYRWIETFGKELNAAEEDLIHVMRAHWVNWANNEDSKGFDTSDKGDLDSIFSLYVEALGGTSLLKQSKRTPGPAGKEEDQIYRERINTDSAHYGGSNVGAPFGEITARDVPWQGKPHSLVLSLPPLACVFFEWNASSV